MRSASTSSSSWTGGGLSHTATTGTQVAPETKPPSRNVHGIWRHSPPAHKEQAYGPGDLPVSGAWWSPLATGSAGPERCPHEQHRCGPQELGRAVEPCAPAAGWGRLKGGWRVGRLGGSRSSWLCSTASIPRSYGSVR